MAAGTHRLALIASVCVLAVAQPDAGTEITRIPVRELQERQRPSFVPARVGQRVQVEGIVTTKAVNFGEYAHLPIRGDDGKGGILERARQTLDDFSPGDIVQAAGVVSHRTGLPVLVIEQISKQGHREPPLPLKASISDLNRFENLGNYVILEAFVVTLGQNSGGDMLVVGGNGSSISAFYPRFTRWNRPGIRPYDAGDKVRITGIASQYCPVAPFDHGFQLLVDDPKQITLIERGWFIPPDVVMYVGFALLFASSIWWIRERRMAAQRRIMRNLMSLSEEVLASNSLGEISRKVQSVLPGVLQASKVDIFLHTRTRNTLDRIPNELSPESFSIALDQPEGAFAAAVALCFRNRTLLNVPDFRKSPVMDRRRDAGLPASAVFVPMFAQGEILGVMAVYYRAHLYEIRHQHAALQHVGNQIAASLRLQEQHSIREQLLRTEKMAAAGQLISGVAHDLRAPLQAIREVATRMQSGANGDGDEAGIASEADRGLQIVNHLLSFAKMEQSEARPVNLHQLVSGVIEAREPEWKRKGILAENALPLSPIEVYADESELEQVFLSLLIHAEHAVQDQAAKNVRVSSRVLGARVQIAIDFSSPTVIPSALQEPTSGDSFGLRVCQAIAQSHGGDIRLIETSEGGFRYELELPVHRARVPAEAPTEPSRHASRVLTTMLIEPDAAVQRKLLAMLSVRGHRAIPVDNAEEAADMVQRMPFDVIFCTIRLPGLTWIEFFKRVRRRIQAFVLLTESYDSGAGGILKDGTGFVLRKPLEEKELDEVLSDVEARHGASRW
jgi:signal transduction histidine kinase/CheY-like chemotaxis protein